MIIIKQTLDYVSSASFFWETMTSIVVCAMFVGATAYNGDIKKVKKWFVTMIPYIALLFTTTFIRLHNVQINSHIQAYAGMATLFIVSFFYILGMFLGVLSVKFAHWLIKKE